MAHRDKYKVIAGDQGVKLTYLSYMVKAVTTVLRKYPILNAQVDSRSNEIVITIFFNVGIVDTPLIICPNY